MASTFEPRVPAKQAKKAGLLLLKLKVSEIFGRLKAGRSRFKYFPSFDELLILCYSFLDMTLDHKDTYPCHSDRGLSYIGTTDARGRVAHWWPGPGQRDQMFSARGSSRTSSIRLLSLSVCLQYDNRCVYASVELNGTIFSNTLPR